MNTILKKALSSALVLTLLSTAAIDTAYANSVTVNTPQAIELKSENISFEYVSTFYNGRSQRPKITVVSNGSSLTENDDFSVTYPDDCTNAGVKTVSINGIGKYSGSFSATYKIEPLDVSGRNVEFSAVAEPCRYNGFEQIPEFTIKVNGITVPSSSYTMSLSNNINAVNNTACELTFGGNFSGKRTVEFSILKAERDDIDIEFNVRPGEHVTYDLSNLLPAGASFGTPTYFSLTFPDNGKPVIAFNELRFTCGDLTSSTAISIPVLGANNFADFHVNVYLTPYSKIVPKLVLKPIILEYSGNEITSDEITSAGCYAEVNGKRIEGEWTIWKAISDKPHTAIPYVVTFDPSDDSYESVDGIIFITVNKISASSFSARLNSSQVDIGRTPVITVSGIPEDRVDKLKIICEELTEGFSYTEYHSPYQNESDYRYKLSFPRKEGIYTITAILPEDNLHKEARSSCTLTIGDYVPPEEQRPDKVTTESELTKMITAAPINGFVSAEGMQSISRELIAAAAAKNLILEVKMNGTYTWVLKTAGLNSAMNLNIDSAAIPPVLTEKIGGTTACSFTVSEKNLGSDVELRVTLKNSQSDSFANLFYYNTSGDLDFVTCARIEADHTAELKLKGSGKYVIITDNETKLFGDINNDRLFNLSDLTDFLKMYVDRAFPSGSISKYDIDGDGEIKLNDITLLLSRYADSK